jgi:malonate-semialdehyde dehydrogenase (acetylating)/methylmalonate-semialdehyde dehydrogenase
MATAAQARTLQNYIGGEWRDAATSDALEDRDPATGELAARVPLSGAGDVDAAVQAARAAQPGWREVPPQERARAVLALATHSFGIGRARRLVTADMGRRWPTPTARPAVASVGRVGGRVPHLLKGETLEIRNGLDVEMVRQTVGVVAAITPFNFPAMIPLWFLPYAVACGNAFILKPSERDPRPAERICELIDDEEIFPTGVVNLVHGGREAARDPRPRRRRRGLFRRPGEHRPADRDPFGPDRQARPGARRRQELDDRRRGRRSGERRAGDHGIGLRRGRPALPGRVGLRDRGR